MIIMMMNKIIILLILLLIDLLEINNIIEATGDDCGGEFKYPKGCSIKDCLYNMNWQYDQYYDKVQFELTGSYSDTQNRSIGLAFYKKSNNNDNKLTNVDEIFGWFIKEQFALADLHHNEWSEPVVDRIQNVDDKFAYDDKNQHLITFRFSRKLNTGDYLEDVNLADDQCVYFIYPIQALNAKSGYNNLPLKDINRKYIMSDDKICLINCIKSKSNDENGITRRPAPVSVPTDRPRTNQNGPASVTCVNLNSQHGYYRF